MPSPPHFLPRIIMSSGSIPGSISILLFKWEKPVFVAPFSFGYPSEQSLWTAYPFTAINNSLPLPPHFPSIQHLSRLLPNSTTTTITPPFAHPLLLALLSGALPFFSLSLRRLHGPRSASPAPAYNLTSTDVCSTIPLFTFHASHSWNPTLFPERFYGRLTFLWESLRILCWQHGGSYCSKTQRDVWHLVQPQSQLWNLFHCREIKPGHKSHVQQRKHKCQESRATSWCTWRDYIYHCRPICQCSNL